MKHEDILSAAWIRQVAILRRLQQGSATTFELTSTIKDTRRTCYDDLRSLNKKGFIERGVTTRVKTWCGKRSSNVMNCWSLTEKGASVLEKEGAKTAVD